MEKKEVSEPLQLIRKVKRDGNSIYVMGNGGSSALASHFVCDLMKVGGCRAFDLSCNAAVMTAYANDMGFENVFVEQLKVLARKGDLIIVISGSGNSPNVVKAVEWARDNGIDTLGLIGFDGRKLKSILDYSIHVSVDTMAEVENVHLTIAHIISEMVSDD